MMNKSLKVLLAGTFLSVSLLAIDSVGTITKTAPAAGSTYNSADTVTFSWTPVSEATKYYYVFDNNGSTVPASASSKLETANNSILIDPSDNLDGTYYFHIQAVDATGTPSFNTTRVNIDVDTLKGTVSMSPDGGSLSSAESLTMTPSETGTIYYTTDGSTPDYNATSVTGTTQVYTAPLSIATAKTVKARVKDSAGNKGNVTEKVFTSTLQVTAKTTQDNSAVDGATFATKSDNLVQTVTPNTSITLSGTGFTRYKYKKSTDADYTVVSDIATPIDISGLATGNYIYYILGGDAYNYKAEENKLTVSFSVDNTAPTLLNLSYDGNATVTKVNPALKTTPSTLMSLSATGASELRYIIQASAPSTYAGYTSTYSSPFALTNAVADGSTGTVTLQYAAKDASGNWAKGSKTYTIDKKDPLITMPAAKTYAAQFTTAISFDDDGNTSNTDIGSIKYLLASETCSTSKASSALTSTYNTSITIPVGSNKCLYAIAIDEVGNESNSTGGVTTVSTTQFTYNNDGTVSTVSVDLLDAQKFATVTTHGATAVTDINVTGASFAKYGYTFDGGSETNTTVSTQELIDGTTISLVSLSDGEHNITINAYVSAGTVGDTIARTFTVDNTAPNPFTSADYVNGNFSTLETTLKLANLDGDKVYYSDDNMSFSQASVDDTNSSRVAITLDKTTTLYTYKEDEVGNKSSIYSATLTQDIPVQSYNLSAGWNMTVLPSGNIATASLSNPIVWDYNGTGWSSNTGNADYGTITTTSSSKGYWVYLSSGESVNIDGADTSSTFSSIVASAPTGGKWTLAGTTSTVSDLSSAYLVWTYTNGVWQYATTNTTLNTTLDSLGYTPTTTINANSAYWLYTE